MYISSHEIIYNVLCLYVNITDKIVLLTTSLSTSSFICNTIYRGNTDEKFSASKHKKMS